MIEKILDWFYDFKEKNTWTKFYMLTHPYANYHARMLAWYKHIDILKDSPELEIVVDHCRRNSNIKIDY